jgi:hypothetical protein
MEETTGTYLCTISHKEQKENGDRLKVTEQYLVYAVSCGDAETTALKEVAGLFEDVESKSSKKIRLSEVIGTVQVADAEFYYMVKVQMITIDESSSREKRKMCPMLVVGMSLADAVRKVHDFMRTSMSDYEVISVAKTKIYSVLDSKKAK